MSASLAIEYVPIAALAPMAGNPRRNAAAVGPVAKSIQRFGWTNPILARRADRVVVAGHTRLEAAKSLKLDKVPVIWLDLDPVSSRLYNLADNKLAEVAEWDAGPLADMLRELSKEDAAGLALAGFGAEDVAKILAESQGGTAGKTDPDSVPEVPKASWVKPGELFRLGDHRLLCGDSTNPKDCARAIGDATGLVSFTSPPYGAAREYEGGKNLDVDHLAGIFAAAPAVECWCVNLGILRRNGAVWPYWDAWIAKAQGAGLKLISWNVWSREGMGGSVGAMTAPFLIEHEWIFVLARESPELTRTRPNKRAGKEATQTVRQSNGSTHRSAPTQVASAKRMGTVLTLPAEMGRQVTKGHPAVFPVKLPLEYLRALAPRMVFEPFCGSGSTLIASQQLDVPCRAIELEPRYVQVAIERWEAFTGRKAEKVAA